jgi:type III restriction enzyme
MPDGISRFGNEDLVLRVSTDVDPARLNLDAYEGFLDALCGTREYQKGAIRTVCRFLGGGEYNSTVELAKGNYDDNSYLAERFGTLNGLLAALPFPDALGCSVDLATGTGKSYVMYGVARILLAEGIVDRVLVLCPSLTIEAGLNVKFKQLSGSDLLRAEIPPSAATRNPEIVDASTTTRVGDVCIENIHATFEHVSGSVRESFAGKGGSTLVLCDEAHHIYTHGAGTDRAIRRWKEFLDDPAFGFNRIAGFSGTCYVGDDYFSDVVARYSIREAMEERTVKLVNYRVTSESQETQESKFQKYLQLHRENQKRYPNLKSLSLLVTNKIRTADDLAREFTSFLAETEDTTPDEAAAKVLVVSSRRDHQANVAQLPYVDSDSSPVEWIFSVSMLTEGWDVKNVFQIIPHEKRAFASKLLIAQVLGRGLRVPPATTNPQVWVFNHVAWAGEIKGLVDEILERERRLHCYPVEEPPRDALHFEVDQLSYETETEEQELVAKNGNGQVKLFRRGYVQFEHQAEELERTDIFTSALSGGEMTLKTSIRYPAFSVDEVVKRIRGRLKSIDAEGETTYSADYPASMLREVIRESLKRIEETRELVSEQNVQQLFRAIGNIHRQTNKTVRIKLKPDQLSTVSTRDLPTRSVALTSFMKEAKVFYDDHSAELSHDDDRRRLDEIVGDESEFPNKASKRIPNAYVFKTPVNVVLTTHRPEREFTRRLFENEIPTKLRAWVKAPDAGWYGIAFSWRKGDHTKRGRFFPDFFLVLEKGSDVLVVEIKDDGDDGDENRAKLRFASEHFERLNAENTGRRYHMKFLSPVSYDAFFQQLKSGNATAYVSALQAALSE